MVMMKITDWDYSNVEAVPEVRRNPLTAGEHHLHIVAAMFNPDKESYELTLRSLDTDEENRITYFMKQKDGTANNYSIGTLNSLKHALTGNAKGILAPCDVIGGIVRAEVKLSKPIENSKGETVQYRSIYHYDPVDRQFFDMVTPTLDKFIENQYLEE